MVAPQFAVEVNFLTGRYVATSHNDRRRGEWPPHPARLFSALVAAWAEVEKPDPVERSALEWIENQGAPAIAASDAVPRKTVSHFVPVNDASIISRTLQERRAIEIYDLLDQIHEGLVASGGEVTQGIDRAMKKLSNKRDLAAAVSRVGRTSPNSALAMLPDGRGKQERRFPCMAPKSPRVTYIWDVYPGDDTIRVLDRLLNRVTRLGHSSSLVACRVTPDPPPPTFLVAANGDGRALRTVRPGQVSELVRRHERHQGVRPRSLPFTDVRYKPAATSPLDQVLEPNTSGEWLVFELTHDSRSFPATRGVELAKAMRKAILAYAEDPIPEGVSGHRADGTPSRLPHMAIVPVPFSGFSHADGRLVGIAVSVPNTLDQSSRTALYRAIGIWERTVREGFASSRRSLTLTLALGARGTVKLRRVVGTADLASLRPSVWRKPSLRWVSVTPVALPQHPGSLSRGTAPARAKAWARAEAAIRMACAHVGLPKPAVVKLSLDPWIVGSRNAAHFPAFRQAARGGKSVRRQLVHVALTFDDLVRGPLMLGAGRFFGLGLMRPMFGEDPWQSSEQTAYE